MTTFRNPRTAAVFPRTRAAARYALQHATSHIAVARAQLLLDQLVRCESTITTGNGRPTPDSYGLLRAVVLTVRDLTGSAWLKANAGDPAVDAFTALHAAPAPPRPQDMDDNLAGVIWSRFAPHGTTPPRPPGPGITADDDDPDGLAGSWPASTYEGKRRITYDEFLAAVRDCGEYADLPAAPATLPCSASPARPDPLPVSADPPR